MKPEYAHEKRVKLSFDTALHETKARLQERGFGIISEIDVREKFRERLGIDYPRHVILGACNPSLAHEALEAEKSVGLLLPCNVVVREDGNDTVVSTVRPVALMSLVRDEAVEAVARKAEKVLTEAVDALP